MSTPSRTQSRVSFYVVGTALCVLVAAGVVLAAQSRRDFDIVAKKYVFVVAGTSAAEIHVRQNDLVHVSFSTEDIPHSFTIEAPYRIMRRAEKGHPVLFDFRADQAGRFPFFCNLTIDEKCKDMKGVLIVDPSP